MDKITSFFTKTDFFSSPHRLIYGSSHKHNTILGGFLTIIVIIFSCFVTVFFGRELIFRSKPYVSKSDKPSELEEISLKSLGITFFFSTTDAGILNKDPEFMKGIQFVALIASFTTVDQKPVATYRQLRVLPCSEELMDANYWEQMSKSIDLSEFLCIDPYEDTADGREEIVIKGEMTNIGAEVLSLSVRLCNEALSPGCRDKVNKSGTFFLQVGMKQSFFNSSSESSPITFISKSMSLLVAPDQTVFQDISFQKNILTDDQGFIFEWPEETEYYSLGRSSYQSRPFYESYASIADVRVGTINVLNLNSRRYMKMQELLADIGGFIKALVILGRLVGSSYSKYKFSILFEKENKETKTQERASRFTIRSQNNASVSQVELKQNSSNSRKQLSFFFYYFGKCFKNSVDEKQMKAFFDVKTINSRIFSLEQKIELKQDKR